jgi:hypothetical protein
MKTPKQNTKPGLVSAFKKQIPSSQAQQTKLTKNSYLIRSSAFSVALLAVSFIASNSARAAVVAMIDVGGAVGIENDLGSLSSSDMQTLITTTSDLTMAGVLDAEGTFGSGDFSNDTGALSDKITGTTRYGRTGGTGQYASGSRWGFIPSAGNETWTPDVLYIGPNSNAGLTHFGLITTTQSNNDRLIVTVTYSDASTEGLEGVAGETNWMGFHKDGEIITSIQVTSPSAGGVFANYDDVSLVFSVPEPSSTALLGLGGLALVLRRKRS